MTSGGRRPDYRVSQRRANGLDARRLAELGRAIASPHVALRQDGATATERLPRAIENPYVDAMSRSASGPVRWDEHGPESCCRPGTTRSPRASHDSGTRTVTMSLEFEDHLFELRDRF